MNYVQTKTFLDAGGSTLLRHIVYYDELGFVAETVDVGVNTSQTPIVARTEYDTRLKPSRVWAPVPASGLDYVDNVYDKARNTYNSIFAYSTNEYDDFQELSSCRKPGDAWEERPVTISRHVVPAGEIRKYSVDADGNLSDDGAYPYGMLTSATTTDEDGWSVTVYTNMHGNTVLERRGTGDNAADTYTFEPSGGEGLEIRICALEAGKDGRMNVTVQLYNSIFDFTSWVSLSIKKEESSSYGYTVWSATSWSEE